MKNKTQSVKSLCLIAMLLLCGCSKSGLDLAPLTGKVTYQGKNLTHGKVVLMPSGETTGPPGLGQIEADGTYSISTTQQSGAIVGTHKVTVTCRREPTEQERQGMVITPLLTPAQYANEMTTPLTVTVEPGGSTFNIELLPKQ